MHTPPNSVGVASNNSGAVDMGAARTGPSDRRAAIEPLCAGPSGRRTAGGALPTVSAPASDAVIPSVDVDENGAGIEQPSSSSQDAAPTAADHGPMSKQDRDLRAEAVSTKQLLRRKPYNKYCEACLKSKMNERRHMTGSYNRDPKRWGEIITADHLVSRGENWTGIRGFRNAVNIKDLWSKRIASVPVRNKGHEEARKAFKWFCGSRKI